MKNLKAVIYILMIGFLASCASSKIASYKNEIIGTWFVKDVTGKMNVSDVIWNQAVREAKSSSYNFYENNSVEIKIGRITNNGKWEFQKGGDELLISRDEGEEISYYVEEISNGQMILNLNLPEGNMRIVLRKL